MMVDLTSHLQHHGNGRHMAAKLLVCLQHLQIKSRMMAAQEVLQNHRIYHVMVAGYPSNSDVSTKPDLYPH